MFGGLLLLSHTHLSAEEIAGCMKFRSQLCFSSHSCAAVWALEGGVLSLSLVLSPITQVHKVFHHAYGEYTFQSIKTKFQGVFLATSFYFN